MSEENRSRERICRELVDTISDMGYPAGFGELIAKNLKGVNSMRRMIAYLHEADPHSAEEIADEMLAICSDRERWVQKKKSEYYNQKYNELLHSGLDTDEDEE